MATTFSQLTQRAPKPNDNFAFDSVADGNTYRATLDAIGATAGAHAIGTVADLQNAPTPATATNGLPLLGYNTALDGGGGTIVWDPDQDKQNHNGVTVFSPTWNNGTFGDTQDSNWYAADGSDTGTGAWIRPELDTINVKQAGAVGDGITDDTTAIQNAIDAAVSEQIVLAARGTYNVGPLTLSSNFHMEDGAQLRYVGAQNGTVITVSAAVNCGDIYIDGDNNDVNGIEFTVDGASARTIRVNNCHASATADLIAGIKINANNIDIEKAVLNDNNNTGHSNASVPRGVNSAGTSDNINISEIVQENGAVGLLTSASTEEITIGKMRLQSLSDNGCYLLGGDISIDDIYYSGNEECVAINGVNSTNIGTVTTFGESIGIIGLDDTNGEVNIDNIFIKEDSTGSTPPRFLFTRNGHVSTKKVTVGSVKGILRSSGCCALDEGIVEYATIENIDITQYYKDTGQTLSRYFDLRVCEGFNIRNINIRIIDENSLLTSSDSFISNPGTPVKQSFIRSFDVHCLQSDEITPGAFRFRGAWAVENIEVSGARWRVDIGPYAREVSFGAPNTAPDAPSIGHWEAQTILYNSSAVFGSWAGWVCVGSGSPGNWRAFGTTEYRELSGTPVGNRTPNYIGEEILDNTNNVWYKSYGLGDTNWAALNS